MNPTAREKKPTRIQRETEDRKKQFEQKTLKDQYATIVREIDERRLMEKRYEDQLESLKRKEMLQRDRVETRAEETRRNRRGEGRLANAESGRTDYLEQQSFRARENEERQEFIRERIAELKLLAERKLMEEAKMAKEAQERTREAERVRKEELNLLPAHPVLDVSLVVVLRILLQNFRNTSQKTSLKLL